MTITKYFSPALKKLTFYFNHGIWDCMKSSTDLGGGKSTEIIVRYQSPNYDRELELGFCHFKRDKGPYFKKVDCDSTYFFYRFGWGQFYGTYSRGAK